MNQYANAGTKKRKNRVTLCLHCQQQGRETQADFVHLNFYPCTDLRPIGLCWPCYNDAAQKLLQAYRSIVMKAAEIEVLHRQIYTR